MIDPQALSLDSSLFKAFQWAAKELNFTRAAAQAGMTQSGISQHVAKLEEQVGTPLFERVNKKVKLTRSGEILLRFIDRQNDALMVLREELAQETRVLSGPVRYAMPQSCLFTPHFPLLLRERREFSAVEIHVDLCPNEEVFRKLLDRQIDFGFVTRKSLNPAVHHEVFAHEEYVLIGGKNLPSPRMEAKDLEELPFIGYPGMDVLFEIWSDQRFPRKKHATSEALKIVGSINSLHGAVTMALEGVGYTVMPSHCAEPYLTQGKLKAYGRSPKSGGAEIYIVSLKNENAPSRVSRVIEAFRRMKN